MNEKRLNQIIYFSFFFSGMTGLIYQVLWSKYLSNIFGATTVAHTTVLAVFMGGLALGNAIFGRLADRAHISLLKVYALLECGIGLYVFFYPNITNYIGIIYTNFARSLSVESTHFSLITTQLVLNSIAILIPATFMGGTIPVMVKYLTKSGNTILKNLSKLYYINSFGAVLGSLICGFYLIRLYGLDTSITIAALTNVAIGMIVYLISKNDRVYSNISTTEDSNIDETAAEDTLLPKVQIYVVLFTIFVSGGISMLYELMWIRVLIQFFGSSVYSFSLVISAFIFGITAGSALLNRLNLPNQKKNIQIYGCLQFGIAITMLISIRFIDVLPEKIWYLQQSINPFSYSYAFFLICKFFLCVCLLILPTTLIGMTLPLAGRLCSGKLNILGKNIGDVFSFNTIGALLGTIVTGLVLLPVFGVQKTFFIGIIINSLLGLIIFIFTNRRFALMGILTIIAMFIFVNIYPPQWNKLNFMLALFRQRVNQDISFKDAFKDKFVNKDILYFKEGKHANVGITKSKINENITLYINGKPDASSSLKGDMSTQLLSGHIPALLHGDPKDVLVIGFGSGVTVGATTLYPNIQNVAVVEILKEVIEAGVYFNHVNENSLSNPKVDIIVDDAKNYMNITSDKFDLIISEPTNPWTSGTASLMTKEAYIKMKSTLKPGGIVLQWFHVYEMSEDILRAVITTFQDVFDHVTLWESLQGDIFLVGSPMPVKPDYTRIEELLSEKGINNSLKQIEADSVYNLLSAQRLGSNRLRHLLYEGDARNFDNFPYVEFNAPKAFFLGKRVNFFNENDMLNRKGLGLIAPYKDKLYLTDYLANKPMQPTDYLSMAIFLYNQAEINAVYSIFRLYPLTEWQAMIDTDDPKHQALLNQFMDFDITYKVLEKKRTLLINQYNEYPTYERYKNILQLHMRNTITELSIFNPGADGMNILEEWITLGMDKYFNDHPDLALMIFNFYKKINFVEKAEYYIDMYIAFAQDTDNDKLLANGLDKKFSLMLMSRNESGLMTVLDEIKREKPDVYSFYLKQAEAIKNK